MKKAKLKYFGVQNKKYCFHDDQESIVQFSGARSDLIFEFQLRENTNIRVWFDVAYFSAYDGGTESKIISDLTIVPI